MENLKREFNWILEDFKNNNIKVSLEHNTFAKKVFDGNDNEEKFEYFIDLFYMPLYKLRYKLKKELDKYSIRASGGECGECGEFVTYIYDAENKELIDYVRNKNTDELERTGCEIVDDYSFEIKFPTGEILCDDRLPYSYDMLSNLDSIHTLNSNTGLKERTLNHAKEDIFHVFVGNSSPDVFKHNDLLAVGHSSNNEISPCSCGTESGCDCDFEEYYPIKNSEKISSICTNLWWASIVDISVYKKLLVNYFGEDKAKEYISKLEPIKKKIKPGVYKCVNFRKETYDNYHEYPSVLATLEWIRSIEE